MVPSRIPVGGGDGTEATLEDGGLRLVDRSARTEIPLAVVREARTVDGQHVGIVLTGSTVHPVDGGDPTAATAFVTALTAVLPRGATRPAAPASRSPRRLPRRRRRR